VRQWHFLNVHMAYRQLLVALIDTWRERKPDDVEVSTTIPRLLTLIFKEMRVLHFFILLDCQGVLGLSRINRSTPRTGL